MLVDLLDNTKLKSAKGYRKPVSRSKCRVRFAMVHDVKINQSFVCLLKITRKHIKYSGLEQPKG